tara:strand:+ start:1134 stop:1352 length:219 start_codon:yes stop_codon:yes gene_type:complete
MVEEKKAMAKEKVMTKQGLTDQMAMEYRVLLAKVDAMGVVKSADFELAKQRLEESWHWIRSGIERLPECEDN